MKAQRETGTGPRLRLGTQESAARARIHHLCDLVLDIMLHVRQRFDRAPAKPRNARARGPGATRAYWSNRGRKTAGCTGLGSPDSMGSPSFSHCGRPPDSTATSVAPNRRKVNHTRGALKMPFWSYTTIGSVSEMPIFPTASANCEGKVDKIG